jgi:hypothetical protein
MKWAALSARFEENDGIAIAKVTIRWEDNIKMGLKERVW